jgi:hypothetical protein
VEPAGLAAGSILLTDPPHFHHSVPPVTPAPPRHPGAPALAGGQGKNFFDIYQNLERSSGKLPVKNNPRRKGDM